jgi:hypothetical protein
MRKENITQTKYMVTAYMLTLGLLFIVVVATPLFIKGHVSLSKKIIIEEDTLEALLIAVLLGLAYTVHRAYRRKLENLKKSNTNLIISHTEAFKYIGRVNIQLQEIQAIFSGLQQYPETKSEFQRILSSAARNMRGTVSVDWILIRIINQNNFRTITEHWESCAKATYPNVRISNRAIVEGKTVEGLSIIRSRRNNLAVNVACIMPVKALMREEKILIEAIVCELEMLFIIFTLKYILRNFTAIRTRKREKSEQERNLRKNSEPGDE